MGTPAARHKIVVVDDERPVLLTLEALLTRHGYEPQLAHTATAGLALVRKFRPDLKFLLITGYAENAAQVGGFLAPGMAMVTKPFAIDALAARIREMLGR